MAKAALIIKCQKKKREYLQSLAQNKKPHHPSKIYNRCPLCGRVRGYMRRFDMCRICFRERASNGLIMGIKKSSW